MGWATYLTTTIEYYKETYKTKWEVEEAIEESNRIIEVCKKDLLSYALITEPKKFCPEESDPLIWLNNEVEDNLQLLEKEIIKLYKLELLLKEWDKCHNKEGKAIKSKDDKLWDKAYIDGDFIEAIVEE